MPAMMDALPRRYSFKLYPTRTQAAALQRQADLLAQLWNAALEQRETAWRHALERRGNWHRVARPKEDKPAGLSFYDQARDLKLIRAADPEYAAMSSASLELCLAALDNAFKGFWRRLKEGCAAGEAGYPAYKSTRRGRTVWHRNGSGWKLSGRGRTWRLYAKGVPGLIKARGKFPAAPLQHRSMEIVWRDGNWWASVVALMAARRTAGARALTITFNLIDEFARVTGADGECLSGWEDGHAPSNERKVPTFERRGAGSPAEGAKFGADDRLLAHHLRCNGPAEGAKFGADDRFHGVQVIGPRPAEGAKFGADDRVPTAQMHARLPAEGAKFGADDRDGADVLSPWTPAEGAKFGADDRLSMNRGCRKNPAEGAKFGADDRKEDTIDFYLKPAEGAKFGADDRTVTTATAWSAPTATGEDRVDALQEARDRRFQKYSLRWRRETRRIARIAAQQARRLRERRHRETTALVEAAASIVAICPPIREATRSARGDARFPGAAIAPVAALNRAVLGHAPGLTLQMLSYKSAEAGIPFARVEPDEHVLDVGRDLRQAARTARQASRKTAKETK